MCVSVFNQFTSAKSSSSSSFPLTSPHSQNHRYSIRAPGRQGEGRRAEGRAGTATSDEGRREKECRKVGERERRADQKKMRVSVAKCRAGSH